MIGNSSSMFAGQQSQGLLGAVSQRENLERGSDTNKTPTIKEAKDFECKGLTGFEFQEVLWDIFGNGLSAGPSKKIQNK